MRCLLFKLKRKGGDSMSKAILREANTKKETTLKEGDVIVYDGTAKSIILWRPREEFSAERLEIDGDDKFYFPLLSPSDLLNIAGLISACTGLSFERTNTYRHQSGAFRFTNPQ